MMALGLLELILIGLFVGVIASQLWSVAARQTMFVAVGVMGLLMLGLIVMGLLIKYQLSETAQAIPFLPSEAIVESAPVRVTARKVAAEKPPVEVVASNKDKPVDRPAWVDAPAALTNGKFERTVSAGPYDTTSLCESELLTQLRLAVNEYIAGYLGPGTERAVSFTDPDLLKLVGQRWVQQVDTSVGPMMYHHARLVLDDSARAEIKQMWRHDAIERRLQWLGGGALVVLSSLLGGYVLLKRQPVG
ncbi:MAG: hypothetical protein JNM18_15990 [Planctomycetaceae bacterium]|nr:hypothetical protein [Planctomycetaceae bacterium]